MKTVNKIQENREKSTFGQLWRQLNLNQRLYAVARLSCGTKAEAAQSVGVKPGTVYGWPDEVERVVEILADDAVAPVIEMLSQALVDAVMVKIDGLQSDDERVKQSVATEIIDRVMGKATQHLEHTGKDGGPIQYEGVGLNAEERNRALAALADAISGAVRAEGGEEAGAMGTTERSTVGSTPEPGR